MTLLLSDSRVRAVDVRDNSERLVQIPKAIGAGIWVREGVARRLNHADALLPAGVRLRVVEGHRSAQAQYAIIGSYTDELRRQYPEADDDELTRLSSRFVAPLAVAPHVAGAAIDVTLVGASGRELDMGTAIDATPEQSDGACFFAAMNITPEASKNRHTMAAALEAAGFVNYPTEWWHWSYGDRYWAIETDADHAIYGPVSPVISSPVTA